MSEASKVTVGNAAEHSDDWRLLQPRRQQSSYSPPWEPQILFWWLFVEHFSDNAVFFFRRLCVLLVSLDKVEAFCSVGPNSWSHFIRFIVWKWVVTPCSLVEFYRRSTGDFCLHHQGDDGQTTRRNIPEDSYLPEKSSSEATNLLRILRGVPHILCYFFLFRSSMYFSALFVFNLRVPEVDLCSSNSLQRLVGFPIPRMRMFQKQMQRSQDISAVVHIFCSVIWDLRFWRRWRCRYLSSGL
jgi:hypothetical protein